MGRMFSKASNNYFTTIGLVVVIHLSLISKEDVMRCMFPLESKRGRILTSVRALRQTMNTSILLCEELVYLHEGPAISVVMKPNCLSYS